MLRSLFVIGVLALVATPGVALAQNFKGSCFQWCSEKRCAAGSYSSNRNFCMSQCVSGCKLKNPNAKD